MKQLKNLLTLASLWLLLGSLAQAGTVHYYYTDPQGTPLVKTDASGNVIARYDYAPYGASVASLGSPPNGPGYTGHVNDPETGLVYMQARYYDPTLARFLSVDPVDPSAGNSFSFNRYAYADNNPIVHNDPDGREAGCISTNTPCLPESAGIITPSQQENLRTAANAVSSFNDDYVIPFAAEYPAGNAFSEGVEGLASGLRALAGTVKTVGKLAEGSEVPLATTAERVSTLKVGPFAGESIPARSTSQTFSSSERAAINDIGNKTGCHTCGTTAPGTKNGNFVPDHQPVSSLNSANAPQKLYPQCLACSRQQGLDAARALRDQQP